MLDFRKTRFIIFSFFISLLLYLPAYSQDIAYIADEDGDDVCVVDLDTNMEIEVITVCDGCDPYWIAASSDANLVAASLHDDTGVALIDPETMSHIANVSCLNIDEPEAIAVNSTGTLVYVADEDEDTLWVVNVATQTCIAGPIDLDTTSCEEPENMVITPDDSTLFITCEDDGDVISVATAGFAITQIADTGEHGIAINPAGTLLYYGDGSTVIEYSIAAGMPTGTEYEGCEMYNGAISPSGDRLYCVEDDDELFIFATSTGALIETVDLTGGFQAAAVAVSCDGAFAYVPDNRTLNIVNTATFDVDTTILTCTLGRGIVILCEILPLTSINLSPPTATNDALTDHTVTATVEIDGVPEPDVLVTFEVTSGPNAGQVSDPNTGECTANDDCTTDVNGQVSWTYTGSRFSGTDTIIASFFDEEEESIIDSNLVEKIWVIPPRNIPTLSEWSLIALAAILGIVGFIVMRRRQMTA